MILDLRQFESFPAEIVLSGDSSSLTLDFQGLNELKSLEVVVRIQESGEEYFCQGTVNATVNIECSRCLNGFDKEIDSSLDFIACAESLHAKVDEKDVLDTEDYAYFTGGDIQADITDVLRQAIILSLSLKPLCSDDCQGLCSQCGVNLNEQQCSCKTEKIDPRWEGLKKLSEQTNENKEHS